jgi:hypothetical protein
MPKATTSAAATNSLGIRYVVDGPPGLKAKLNEIIRSFDYLFPRTSADIIPTVEPEGTRYTLRNPSPASSRPRPPAPGPFTLYDASTTTGGTTTLKIGVVSGTVNLVVPTLGGVALDNVPPPTATITASTWFWLKVVGTFGTPDTYAVTVETSSTSAVPSGTTITGTGFVSFLSIGSVTIASGAITAIAPANNYNWNVESYGSVNRWFR